MNFLVDTNVLSELRKPQPNANVTAWARTQPAQSLYLSVLSLGEIRKGIEKVENTSFRRKLVAWLERDLPRYFVGRILDVDAAVADRWGRLLGQAPRTLPAIDAMIAATALHHGLMLVTRNVADFAGLEVPLLNPWDTEA